MRLTFIFAVVIAATFQASGASLVPLVKESKAVIENRDSPVFGDAIRVEGGRLLRRVEKNEDDDEEEERGFGDFAKKMNPAKLVKKSAKATAEHAEKVKTILKDAADFEKMMEKARLAVHND